MYTDRPVRRLRVAVTLATLLFLLTTGTVATAPAAFAHAALMSSTPADGATLDRLPERAEFVFNEDINPAYAQMVVQAGGTPAALNPVAVRGPSVSAALPRELSAGPITLRYRVVSADGHPVSGQITFTYRPAAGAPSSSGAAGQDPTGAASSGGPSAATATPATTDTTVAPASAARRGGRDWLPSAALALGAIALIGVGVWLLRSARRSRPRP